MKTIMYFDKKTTPPFREYHSHPTMYCDKTPTLSITIVTNSDGYISLITMQAGDRYLNIAHELHDGVYVNTKTLEYAMEGTNEGRLMKMKMMGENK